MSSNEGKGSADPELTGKNGGEFIKPSNSDQSQQDYGTADELIMQQVALGNGTAKDSLQGPETRLQKTKRVLTEGHTFGDAILTVTAGQIGQVLLVAPNSLYLTGLKAGLVSSIGSMIISIWTMYILEALFLERKRDLIKAGKWFNADGMRTRVTQYHEVMGHFLGRPLGIASQILIILTNGGTSLAQIIACSGDVYAIEPSHSKRTYAIIFGAILCLFAFVPSFRHFRVLNVIALIGTSYTSMYILISTAIKGKSPTADPGRGPISAEGYFNGAAVLISALGSHSIALEMMDSMRNQREFLGAFNFGFMWSLTLTIPHSVSVNLVYPQAIADNDNVFGLLPVNTGLKIAVWLMVIHQFVAFALYTIPTLYMFEKLCGVHERSMLIRIPVRLPIVLIIYLLGVMLPFYGSINALIGAFGPPITAFCLPAFAFNWVFRKKERRAVAVFPPLRPFSYWNWNVAILLNWVIGLTYAGFCGGAIYYSIKSIADAASTFGVFAACYQCD